MAAVDAYFSLGSNLGDRQAFLDRALALMQERLPGVLEAVSRTMETEPVGFDSPHRFLNLAARFRLEFPSAEGETEALHVLDICQGIEAELGKTVREALYDGDGNRVYEDRPIDIDLIFFGDAVIRHPRLTVPHPRWKERDFVRIPLSEIMKNSYLCEHK